MSKRKICVLLGVAAFVSEMVVEAVPKQRSGVSQEYDQSQHKREKCREEHEHSPDQQGDAAEQGSVISEKKEPEEKRGFCCVDSSEEGCGLNKEGNVRKCDASPDRFCVVKGEDGGQDCPQKEECVSGKEIPEKKSSSEKMVPRDDCSSPKNRREENSSQSEKVRETDEFPGLSTGSAFRPGITFAELVGRGTPETRPETRENQQQPVGNYYIEMLRRVMEGRYPSMTQNIVADLGGVPTSGNISIPMPSPQEGTQNPFGTQDAIQILEYGGEFVNPGQDVFQQKSRAKRREFQFPGMCIRRTSFNEDGRINEDGRKGL